MRERSKFSLVFCVISQNSIVGKHNGRKIFPLFTSSLKHHSTIHPIPHAHEPHLNADRSISSIIDSNLTHSNLTHTLTLIYTYRIYLMLTEFNYIRHHNTWTVISMHCICKYIYILLMLMHT